MSHFVQNPNIQRRDKCRFNSLQPRQQNTTKAFTYVRAITKLYTYNIKVAGIWGSCVGHTKSTEEGCVPLQQHVLLQRNFHNNFGVSSYGKLSGGVLRTPAGVHSITLDPVMLHDTATLRRGKRRGDDSTPSSSESFPATIAYGVA